MDKWMPTCSLEYRRVEHPHGGYDVFLEQLWEREVPIPSHDFNGDIHLLPVVETEWRRVKEVR